MGTWRRGCVCKAAAAWAGESHAASFLSGGWVVSRCDGRSQLCDLGVVVDESWASAHILPRLQQQQGWGEDGWMYLCAGTGNTGK